MFKNAYPNLSYIYQYILTLPVSEVTCERTFSALKFIKNKYRNTISDEHLESFMILNIENDLLSKIGNEKVINILASTSTLLKKNLLIE